MAEEYTEEREQQVQDERTRFLSGTTTLFLAFCDSM